MRTKKYKFKIPIGDWSDDGHGKHDDYIIESNQPVERVRELYFQACDKIGFSLDGSYKETDLTPFSDYEDFTFSGETLDALLEFGVKLDEDDVKYIREQESTDGHDLFLKIIIAFIQTQDKKLKLKVVPENQVDMLPFYGFDKKQRHIGYFGYGLFS